MARSLTQVEISLRLKKRFLDAFGRCGVLKWAADRAGVSRRVVYDWRREDPDFALAFDEAALDSLEALEYEAFRRAREGVPKPVYWQGERVGQVREYSDTLLIFLLKARAPDIYRTGPERADPDKGAALRAQLASRAGDGTAESLAGALAAITRNLPPDAVDAIAERLVAGARGPDVDGPRHPGPLEPDPAP